jgi:hypothetical protein
VVENVVLMWWRGRGRRTGWTAWSTPLVPWADQGIIWLMTPKPGPPRAYEAEDIADAAPTAGLQPTSTISAGANWQGTRLVAPRAKR